MKKTYNLLFLTLVTLVSFNTISQKTITITTADSLTLTEYNLNARETIYSPSIEGIMEEVLYTCEGLEYDFFVLRQYPYEFSPKMIEDDNNWIILNDTLKIDTAFSLIEDGDDKLFVKYYPGGQIMQKGKLTNLQPENIKYDFSLIETKDIAFCRNWIDSTYTNKPIAVGHWEFFHDNGELASEGDYNPISTAQVSLLFDPYQNENILELTINDYCQAQKTGEWNYYNKTGKQLISQTIENGKMISMTCFQDE